MAILIGKEGILLYNDAYSQIAGTRHPDSLGASALLSWPEIADFNRHVIETCLAGGSLSFRDEHLILHRRGLPEDVWLDIDYSPIRNDAGVPIGAFASVAETTGKILAQSESRRIEDALRIERSSIEDANYRLVAETDFLRQLFEKSPSFIAVLRGPDHRFELANDAFLRLVGRTGVVGKTVPEVIPEVAGQGFIELLDGVYRTGEAYAGKGVRIALKGAGEEAALAERVVDLIYQPMRSKTGAIVGIMAEGTDVTEHFRAHERLRVAQDSGGVATFEWFPKSGRMEVSSRFCEMWGLPRSSESTVDELVALVHPDDRHLLGLVRDSGIANPLEYVEFRITLPKTGEIRWLSRRGEAVGGQGDSPRRYFGAILDITHRKHAEERQGFLLRLSDRLQFAHDAAAVTLSVAGDLAALLGAARIGYAHVQPDGSIVTEEVWTDGSVGSLFASHGLDQLGPSIRNALAAGELVVIPDTRTGDFTPDVVARWEGAHIRTLILAPMLESQVLSALLYVKGNAPREWTDAEIGLVREVAERMRSTNERRRDQVALRDSESQFRSLVEAVPHQVWIADPAGMLTWFNSRVYEYTGAREGELNGERWASVVHPDDLPGAVDQWSAAIRDGTVYETEFRLLHGSDQTWRWFLARAVPVRDADLNILRWIGTNTDVHAQKTAAAELEAMNSILEQRVEERTRDRERMWRISTDIMIVAGSDHRITSVNPAWTNVLGWTESHVAGRRLEHYAHPEDRDRMVAAMVPLGEPGGTAAFDGRFLHNDESYRWMAWTAVSDGQYMHAVGRDVTRQKEAAKALAVAEEALRQSQKMEAVGQLTGGIAHDFNNLLQGITGSLELIHDRVRGGRTDDLQRLVSGAMASAQRATGLTHRLLAFSRRQPLSPKVVKLNELTLSLEELLRRTMGESIRLAFDLDAHLWTTLSDPNQIESALLNLAINARDAMPNGGVLSIQTANVEHVQTDVRGLRDLEPGAYVRLSVTDTGTGMSPDIVERAFDPFFTTKPIGQGTGLGLSMVYGFARQSGGVVSIHSKAGEGTTVALYLPRATEGFAHPDPEQTLSEGAHRADGEQVVLVMEDEAIVRSLVVEVLSDLGYRTIEAADGPSGLEVLQSTRRVDLLVTDIGLPGLNGRQVADAARIERPELKILFMTGYAENVTIARGMLEPGMSMITKPFSLDALASRVQEIMTGDPT